MIVEEILEKEHPTGYVDKMQLFEECRVIYERMKSDEQASKHPANFVWEGKHKNFLYTTKYRLKRDHRQENSQDERKIIFDDFYTF